MSAATRLITAAELLKMGPGRRELVKGEVREMPPAGGEQGERALEIGRILKNFVVEKKIAGKVYAAETGFVVEERPDTVRAPDAAFVSIARLDGSSSPKGFIPFGPDLAVEVMSPGDTVSEVEDKVDQYLAAGSRLVWVVNLHRKTVTVYRPNAVPKLLSLDEILDGGDVLPGFAVKVAEIFA